MGKSVHGEIDEGKVQDATRNGFLPIFFFSLKRLCSTAQMMSACRVSPLVTLARCPTILPPPSLQMLKVLEPYQLRR